LICHTDHIRHLLLAEPQHDASFSNTVADEVIDIRTLIHNPARVFVEWHHLPISRSGAIARYRYCLAEPVVTARPWQLHRVMNPHSMPGGAARFRPRDVVPALGSNVRWKYQANLTTVAGITLEHNTIERKQLCSSPEFAQAGIAQPISGFAQLISSHLSQPPSAGSRVPDSGRAGKLLVPS
jgi:hypothetical protein